MNVSWKPIKNYEGLYEISNHGIIKSLEHININSLGVKSIFKTKILNPPPNNKGYLVVQLMKSGKRKTFSIHRLVAFTFILNPQNKPEVNHKDGIKTNNKVNNLEWSTKSENGQHAYNIGLNKGSGKSVLQFTKSNEYINEYKSIHNASNLTGVGYEGIWKCCHKKRKISGNFIWKFK